MRVCVILAGVLAATSPAVAQDVPAAPAPDKKVCKTITPIGSIMGKRFCLTKAEWQQLNDINERNAEQGLNGRKLNIQKGGAPG